MGRYDADLDTESKPEWVYLEREASPAMPISSDDDTDSTEVSGCALDSDLAPDVDIRIEDEVDAPDGIELDCDVDMDRDGDNEVQEVEYKYDEEEEDENEDDGIEPGTIGQEEVVNTSHEVVDSMVDAQRMVLHEQKQEMREYTTWPQPPALSPPPQTLEPRPRPQTPETHPLSRLAHLGCMTQQNPCTAVRTLGETEAAGTTADVDVNQQLLIK
jgi:hypothetical protein